MTNGQESPYYGGGGGGDIFDLTLPENAVVTSVEFKYGDMIDSLKFNTSMGWFRFGGSGGSKKKTEYLPAGTRIIGFYGTTGKYCMNSVGLIVAMINLIIIIIIIIIIIETYKSAKILKKNNLSIKNPI